MGDIGSIILKWIHFLTRHLSQSAVSFHDVYQRPKLEEAETTLVGSWPILK